MADILPAVELTTAEPVHASVVWLHGLGADGHDFEPIVPALAVGPGVRFVFPHAPVRPVTVNGGMSMRAWYDVAGLDLDSKQDAVGIGESDALVRALLEREMERGTPPERILLAGFSQGGAMALHTGLRFGHRLAGIVALSTYLPLHDRFDAEANAANRATPIFMAHGTNDPVVPVTLGEGTRDFLVERDLSVSWSSYPMGHEVCPEEIVALNAWFGEQAGFRTETDS